MSRSLLYRGLAVALSASLFAACADDQTRQQAASANVKIYLPGQGSEPTPPESEQPLVKPNFFDAGSERNFAAAMCSDGAPPQAFTSMSDADAAACIRGGDDFPGRTGDMKDCKNSFTGPMADIYAWIIWFYTTNPGYTCINSLFRNGTTKPPAVTPPIDHGGGAREDPKRDKNATTTTMQISSRAFGAFDELDTVEVTGGTRPPTTTPPTTTPPKPACDPCLAAASLIKKALEEMAKNQPAPKGPIYRGMCIDEKRYDTLMSCGENCDAAPQSTSFDKGIAENFAAGCAAPKKGLVMQIDDVPAGAAVGACSQYKGEKEFLTVPGLCVGFKPAPKPPVVTPPPPPPPAPTCSCGPDVTGNWCAVWKNGSPIAWTPNIQPGWCSVVCNPTTGVLGPYLNGPQCAPAPAPRRDEPLIISD